MWHHYTKDLEKSEEIHKRRVNFNTWGRIRRWVCMKTYVRVKLWRRFINSFTSTLMWISLVNLSISSFFLDFMSNNILISTFLFHTFSIRVTHCCFSRRFITMTFKYARTFFITKLFLNQFYSFQMVLSLSLFII